MTLGIGFSMISTAFWGTGSHMYYLIVNYTSFWTLSPKDYLNINL